VLDVRVIKKNYGNSFLKALPGTARKIGSQEEVLAEMEKFFTSAL
jgi:Rad3-related DNA helicase